MVDSAGSLVFLTPASQNVLVQSALQDGQSIDFTDRGPGGQSKKLLILASFRSRLVKHCFS